MKFLVLVGFLTGCGGSADVATGGPQPPVSNLCGNGLRDGLEACDDSNTAPGDGCDSTCTVELGWECGSLGPCKPVCGDGHMVGPEPCDDDNNDPLDGCDRCVLTCGNGTREIGPVVKEACDDGNVNNGDGCTSTCIVEDGWVCPAEGACYPAHCFNGVADADEAGVDCGASCGVCPGWPCVQDGDCETATDALGNYPMCANGRCCRADQDECRTNTCFTCSHPAHQDVCVPVSVGVSCGPGLVCDQTRTCAPSSLALFGEACMADTDCVSGACAMGLCRLPAGYPCKQNIECASGACSQNFWCE
jgi:cysteine-rich repeat protein